ncbi:hypothetical protein [Bacillus sp. T3]|uniref:hypothetical protein n=1 Tax=Bacillus sp. T3 TaxID=467262 RepID=UPI002980CEAE|nr:hypothetical protein [Bacillus sp. T3]
MKIGYAWLTTIFSKTAGIQDLSLEFDTVATNGEEEQPRGLFIPLWGNSNELLDAIHNGAIAAIWEEDHKLPAYTPNHFPIFFTKDLETDIKIMLESYIETVKQEEERTQMSNFINVELLNEKMKTYDDSDKVKPIMQLMQTLEDVRRG